MFDARSVRRTLVLVGIAAAVAIPAFVMSSGPQQTDASWVVTKTAAVTATAVTPAQPTALACPVSGLLTNVAFTWSAPPGPTPSGYTLKWGSGSTTSTTTSGSVPTPLGTIIVSVYADYGNWESAAGILTRTVIGALVTFTCG